MSGLHVNVPLAMDVHSVHILYQKIAHGDSPFILAPIEEYKPTLGNSHCEIGLETDCSKDHSKVLTRLCSSRCNGTEFDC